LDSQGFYLIYWADKMGFKVEKIEGQYGFPVIWKLFPSLFASGVVYILEPKEGKKR